ncbi:hypothetical protein [Deinococcus sonorensis]|uniref:Uncharacterized protein n=2 Tax=Deinococcus sonorensis TaxID=309891 RepID=A0AAU7UDY8_9DEIO
MTGDQTLRLQRVLHLALSSPYPGERDKAVTLLAQLLAKAGIGLHQLDGSFTPGASLDDLRRRAGLPCPHTVLIRSREELTLYHHLIRQLAPHAWPPAALAEDTQGYRLTYVVEAALHLELDRRYQQARTALPARLAAAQQQAQREYQARRQVLFDEAIQALAQGTGGAQP